MLRHTGLRIGELLDLEARLPHGLWPEWHVAAGATRQAQRRAGRPARRHRLRAFAEWLGSARPPAFAPTSSVTAACAISSLSNAADGSGREASSRARRRRRGSRAAGCGRPGRCGSWPTSFATPGRPSWSMRACPSRRSWPCSVIDSPEMTIRYARLASPTLRAAYDQALGKVAPEAPRRHRPDARPSRSGQLAGRRDAQDPCRPRVLRPGAGRGGLPLCQRLRDLSQLRDDSDFVPALEDQLNDIRACETTPETTAWNAEVRRHEQVIASLEGHLRRLVDP